MRRRYLGVLLLAGIVLGACGGDDGGSASNTRVAASPATAGGSGGGAKTDTVAVAAAPAQNQQAGGGGSAVVDDPAVLASKAAGQKVIYTGRIQIEVKGAVFDASLQAKNIVTINEGFLFSETTVQKEDGQPQSSMTFKLPPEKFAAVMDQFVKQLGTEKGRQVEASDVTAQFVDLSSRLKVAETSLERVRKLLAEAKTVQEILSLEGEVAKREANVEGLKGQLNQLNARVEYATVTLTIAQKLAPPKVEKKDDGIPSPLEGLKAGARAFLGALKVVILVLAVVLPFIPLAAILWWVAKFIHRRLPPRRERPNRAYSPWNQSPWPNHPAPPVQTAVTAPEPVAATVGSAQGGEELGRTESQVE